MPKEGDVYVFKDGEWVKQTGNMTVEQCHKIMARDAMTIWEQDQELRQLRRDIANLRRKRRKQLLKGKKR
jgi:hypothetical protein